MLRAQLTRLDDADRHCGSERWRGAFRAARGDARRRAAARDDRADRNPHYMAMFRIPGISEADRNAFVEELNRRGLPAFVAFRAFYRTDAFWERCAPSETPEQIAERCPIAEAIHRDCVWLHHRTLLGTEEQMRSICDVLADALASR